MIGKWNHRRDAERGAAAVLVAVLFAGGVVMGAAAISVDVGNIMHERRQLQNGADAVAMSLAIDCVEDITLCDHARTTNPLDPLNDLNDANAVDEGHGWNDKYYTNGMCGYKVPAGANLDTCTVAESDTGVLVDCPSLPTGFHPDIPYVEVYTETAADGTTFLPTPFANALSGGPSTTTVEACARVAWGDAALPKVGVLPITMSYCDWAKLVGADPVTGLGGSFPPGPEGPWPGYDGGSRPWPNAAFVDDVYTKGNPTDCETWNGHTAPGGFAALDTAVGCETEVINGAWLHGNPGNDLPCSDDELDDLYGTVVFIPVFDCEADTPSMPADPLTMCDSGNGSHNYYHIAGYAAFYINGWHLTSYNKPSLRPGTTVCPAGGDRCLSGWFLEDLAPTGDIKPPGSPGPSFGVKVVKPIG